MSDPIILPGFREQIWLAGRAIGSGASVAPPKDEVAQTRDRYLDGSLAVDGLALPWAGAPSVIEKRVWTLTWPALVPADVVFLNRLVSLRGILPVDFVPWLPWSESFLIAAGAARSGTLGRRAALSVVDPLPDLAATRFATTAARGGSNLSAWTDLTVTLGATDAAGHTPWTAAGTSTDAEFVSISYYPAYRVVVGEAQQTFVVTHSQGQSLTLEEV